jgi:hypothetical protein
MAKSAQDIRSPIGLCPLMSEKVQLLPLRYGLVEHLDPSSELTLLFKLNSQPLGIRLLRDGFLYIIDNGTGYLHEYRVEQGQISKLLWQGPEVAGDTRTTSVGEPHLVFARQHTLFASYSEISGRPSSVRKCSRTPPSERLMQRIELAKACPDRGGADLLSRRQAQTWLAEVAEADAPAQGHESLPEGAHPQERQPYVWEDRPLFKATVIEALTSQVLGVIRTTACSWSCAMTLA